MSIAIDSAAPRSPPHVAQFRYPAGYPGGAAPGTPVFPLPGVRRVVATFWWKSNPAWQGHLTGSNKLAYVFHENAERLFFALYGPPGGPYHLRVYPTYSGQWLEPNVAEALVTVGEWHRIQWLLDANSGTVRWWLDGQLVGDHCGVPFPAEPFTDFRLAAVWGGIGDVKQHDDFFWYDHVLVSVWPVRPD